MEFLSTCYRQQDERAVSLLLQQYEYRGVQVLFACICTGAGECGDRAAGHMTGQLLQWFRGLPLRKRMGRPEKEMNRLQVGLAEVINRTDRELEEGKLMTGSGTVSLAGLLCLGDNYILLHRGNSRIYLINTAFGRVHLQQLAGGTGEEAALEQGWSTEQNVQMERGVLQKDIGLLLATASFCRYVTETMIKEGLFVGEVVTEAQMCRHLGELAREGERLGGSGMGAILLRSAERGEKESTVLERRGYRCLELLGQGSFSGVYRVEEKATGKVFACKISESIHLLQREFAVMRELSHPLFPKVFEFWQEAGTGYLLTEYVPGINLEEMLKRREPFSVGQVVRMGMELAEGLLYLHEGREPILFRDVKPENIMLRQDCQIKLLDFGCVCALGQPAASRAGSPGFASPEQLSGEGVLTAACDVYGLGRTLKAMLEVGNADNGDSAPRKQLLQILDDCTRREPSDRLPDMRSVINALMLLYREEKADRRFSPGRKRELFDGNIRWRKNIWESPYKNF